MKRVCNKKKKSSKLTTNPYEVADWDYGHKIRNFRRISDIVTIREALRTKITYCYRKQYNELLQIDETNNSRDVTATYDFTKIIDPLAAQWQDEHLRTAMSKLEKLQATYQETSKLQKLSEQLQDKRMVINMRIIYFENDLARFTLLQNFQYMLKEPDWRNENDWIHRKTDGKLENYRESIENRETLFIRLRDNDDAFLIRTFFQTKYEPINHPVLVPFKATQDFLDIVDYMKSQTFRALLELHLTMWLHAETVQKFKKFQEISSRNLGHRKEIVDRRCNKKWFNEKRAAMLNKSFVKTEIDLYKSLKSKTETKVEPVVETILLKLMKKGDDPSALQKLSVMDKISCVESMIQDLLHVLDDIPPQIIATVEKKLRTRREYVLRQAQRTCDMEFQMEMAMKSLKKNMEPPFIKPPREGRLPISKLPPSRKKPPPPPPVPTLREKIFVEAFTDHEVREMDINAKENKKILSDIERSCMPFYYDYFLERKFGYHAEKEFETNIERCDGKEEDRFRYKDVVPTVMKRIQNWERQQEFVKHYNISQTEHLYKIRKESES